MAMQLNPLCATEKKKKMRDHIWEAICTRLGCMDYQWQIHWKSWSLSLKTDVELDPLPEMKQFVVYTTICIGPIQVITYDVRDRPARAAR